MINAAYNQANFPSLICTTFRIDLENSPQRRHKKTRHIENLLGIYEKETFEISVKFTQFSMLVKTFSLSFALRDREREMKEEAEADEQSAQIAGKYQFNGL